MRRAFLSLYGLIVLSVIAVGWGLDKLWQYYAPVEVVAQTDQDTFRLVETILSNIPTSDWGVTIDDLNHHLGLTINVFSVEDFAQSKLLQKIVTGELVIVYDGSHTRLLYKIFQPNSSPKVSSQGSNHSRSILRLSYPISRPSGALLYDLLLLVFYGAIALVVFIWVWPLSRDLGKLERYTKLVGRDQIPESLHISHTSTVFDLASAFNRMSQRVRELLASHKEMTYAVSHELRTPLARMKFALEMAGNSNDATAIKHKMLGVREDVTEMDDLVTQLLSYASFEQNDQPLNLQPGDLNCLIEQLIKRIEHADELRKVQFLFTFCDHDFAKKVVCEWHLMERAVSNLLQNAHRHARSQVVVKIFQESGRINISVSDDGPGVPELERERIFQSYVRLQTDINARSRGFGLGLAIVQRVMHWHTGFVSVTESERGGACFTLSWPIFE